jgi:magnesium-transporting ATPase (P-type)
MGSARWKDKTGGRLTLNEMQFVKLYCFGPKGVRSNATESYLQAFHMGDKAVKRESIAVYACELLRKDSVRNAIKKNIEIFNEEWVKLRLQEESTNYENKAADRIRATELVGKTMGMFIKKVEQDVKIDGILINNDEKL